MGEGKATSLGCNELVARLARACARGWRQEQLVTELLTGHVDILCNHFGVEYGKAKVGPQSYRNLRNRLISVGFVFEKSYKNKWMGVIMSFPERKKES